MAIERVVSGMRPTGSLHLGHYKAIIVPDGKSYTKPEEYPAIYLWNIIYMIINASIRLEKGPTSWTQVQQLVMEKRAGDNRLTRTRNINHYESPYNLVLKYHWTKVAQGNGEKAGILGSSQYGGRKQRRSSDVAFINEMIMEYHRITYVEIGITQHDNKACFDRTVANIITLNNKKFNVPQDICKLVTNTKETMQYTIVTKYGPSKKSYSHSDEHPIHGSGQGAGNSGTEWTF